METAEQRVDMGHQSMAELLQANDVNAESLFLLNMYLSNKSTKLATRQIRSAPDEGSSRYLRAAVVQIMKAQKVPEHSVFIRGAGQELPSGPVSA